MVCLKIRHRKGLESIVPNLVMGSGSLCRSCLNGFEAPGQRPLSPADWMTKERKQAQGWEQCRRWKPSPAGSQTFLHAPEIWGDEENLQGSHRDAYEICSHGPLRGRTCSFTVCWWCLIEGIKPNPVKDLFSEEAWGCDWGEVCSG